MVRSTWPKRQCCPQALASLRSGPLPRTAKALLERGIYVDISSIFIQVSQGKGKPSVFPGLLVLEGCFAVVSHRSSLPEARARASDLAPLPSLAPRSQHAEQADSVHASHRQGQALDLFKTKGIWARWVHRHDHAERREMHRGGTGFTDFTRESFHSPAVSVGWCAPSSRTPLHCCCCSG